VITAPVPQALDLMRSGGMIGGGGGDIVAPEPLQLLESVAYDPCFSLILVLDRPSFVPEPGGIQFPADGSSPIAWLADNRQKGISTVPALTVHATGTFSRDHFDTPPDEVSAMLLEAVRPWIDGDPATAVIERSLHRWKFALPTTIVPEPLVAVTQAPPVVCCGDAFAGPRVEGAASSGLAAGRWMQRVLTEQ
jgi:predicted NAD/FAD-dependent oxidoreductase